MKKLFCIEGSVCAGKTTLALNLILRWKLDQIDTGIVHHCAVTTPSPLSFLGRYISSRGKILAYAGTDGLLTSDYIDCLDKHDDHWLFIDKRKLSKPWIMHALVRGYRLETFLLYTPEEIARSRWFDRPHRQGFDRREYDYFATSTTEGSQKRTEELYRFGASQVYHIMEHDIVGRIDMVESTLDISPIVEGDSFLDFRAKTVPELYSSFRSTGASTA